MKIKGRLIIAVLCALLVGLSPALSQEDFGFMPKGGKTLLILTLGQPPDTTELRRMAMVQGNSEAWQADLAPRTGAMNERERRTLAEYLAVNMPLAKETLDMAEKKGEITAALPPDGQELAMNYCQFCHSFFSGYLMIERDVQGWLGTFETPFHREVEMTEKERETFARYAAINMPMKIEDVPEDLRF